MRRIGPGKAADLIFTGRRVGVGEAAELGLVDRTAGKGEAGRVAGELAQAIAKNSPIATRAAKKAMRLGAGVDLAAGLDIEENAWRTAALSADRREGIAAFNEKRSPRWPGV